MKFVLLIICSYLLGSVPFAMIIARTRSIDLRKVGSGNIGATNLSRALGKKWGIICFALDVLKGFLPVFIGSRLVSPSPGHTELFFWLAAAIAAVIGHIFPVYIGFKGGKGVATSFGVAMGFWPYLTLCALIALAVWVVTVLIWRYVSLSSILGTAAFPVALIIMIAIKDRWNFSDLWPLMIVAIGIPLIVTIRHRSNIARIIAHTEDKISIMKTSRK